MTYQEVLEQARGAMGPYCKACPVCNGLACKNSVPGPGAKGIGTGAIRNYQKWQELCVNMDTICENKPVDTSAQLFGRTFALPVFAAPVGALTLHYGDKFDDPAYNDILVAACAQAGIAAFTGDGTAPAVMEGAAAAIAKNSGCGVPTVKPWNLDTIRQMMDLVKAAGPFAIAMNWDRWNSLLAEYQEAIDAISGRDASVVSARAFEDAMNAGIEQIKASNGSNGQPGEFITPTDEELAGWQVAADEYAAQWCESITESVGIDGAAYLAQAQESIAQYE